MQIFRDRLDNGLRIVIVPQPHLHVCEMACHVGVGSRHEPAELAGIAHFLEHMLFRGNRDYPDTLALERAFEAIGGTANAATDAETTCYFSRLHPDQVAAGSRLFASLLCRPLWHGLETERRIIIEEALEDLNEGGEMINPDVLVGQLLWPGHPLGQPTIGTGDTLRRIDRPALEAFHRRHYTPANTVVVVCGRVDVDVARSAIADAFGAWQGALPEPPVAAHNSAAAAAPQSVWVDDSSSQVSIQLSLQLPGRHDPDAFAMRIWRRILSWGSTSRLMLRLREELGLTYHVEAGLNLLADTGCLSVDLAVHPDNLLPALREVLAVLTGMRRDPVPPDELQRVVQSFCYDLEFSRDHADELTVRHGWGELVGYHRSIDDDLADAAALDVTQLQGAALRLVRRGRLALAVVGPYHEEDRSEAESLLQRLDC